MIALAGRPAPTLGEAMRLKLAGFVRTLRDNGFTIGLAETRDALSILTSPALAARLVAEARVAGALFGGPFGL